MKIVANRIIASLSKQRDTTQTFWDGSSLLCALLIVTAQQQQQNLMTFFSN